ncbi:MAG: M3 family oligoendopeptidase [Anaerotignaceae bacterium]
MVTTWNLDSLYLSFDDENFKKDFSFVKDEITKFNNWVNSTLLSEGNTTEKIEFYINFFTKLGSTASKLGEYAQLSLSTDAKNQRAVKVIEEIENLLTETTEAETTFEKWLSSVSNLDEIINSSKILKEHEFYLKEKVKNNKYLLSEKEEAVISKMRNTGSLAWMRLWETLSSSLMVNIDGEMHPIANVRNMAYSEKEETRKKAYESEIKALSTIAESSAACLNSIKGEVITSCQMRKYNSPLEMSLINSRLSKEVLSAMIEAMKESLPIFRKYFIKKAEILGNNKGLPFYNLFAPIGEVNMKFTYEEAKNFVVENFYGFSKELGDYAKFAFENQWIDVYPKEGKRGGAFCANLHSIKESRILTNFGQTFNDVITLAHELGHGYHGACLEEEMYLNSDYPMPIAETASTFCETLVKMSALKKASEKEKLFMLEADISDSAQIVVDILSRFIFEDSFFENRKDGSLSVEEINQLMINAQKETYGEGLDNDFLHQYMWVVKPHYYDVDYNYYNFPYAFGLLFAKGLYSIYINEGSSFSEKYSKLLGATGKNNLKDIGDIIGIDITKKEFWQKSLKVIEKDIELFLSL